jgi:gamma-glutamylcysteine synthetase
MKKMKTNYLGYRVNRNSIDYAIRFSDKFKEDIKDAMPEFEFWMSNFHSPIELKIGDKILISPNAQIENTKEGVLYDEKCLYEIYGAISGELMCKVVDIYFNLSYYSDMTKDKYNKEFDEMDKVNFDKNLYYYFYDDYRNSRFTIVIEPVEKPIKK